MSVLAKRFGAEFIGTWFIVFCPVAVGGAVAGRYASASLTVSAAVSGLAVLAMIATFGPISAAHFNPAVTLAFGAARRLPFSHIVPYLVAQFMGAAAAAAACAAIFGAGHGAHIPTVGWPRAVAVEAAITAALMLVIMGVATDSRVDGALPALAIGLTVVMGVLIGGPLTGGSMNPARSFGPALFAGSTALRVWWIYLIGPCIGAVLAALAYEAVRLEPAAAVAAPKHPI